MSGGGDQWRILQLPSGERYMQYVNNQSTYYTLRYDCPAARTNGEDVCGAVMVEADVRIDGNAAFGDTAIMLRQNGKIERAAIVDLDVHQGNGNASILGGRDDIYILSIQGERNFPFRRVDSTVDVDLPDGTSDFLYLETLSKFLPAVFEFKPDIVFYQAGVDPLKEDRLGRLALSLEGLIQRDRMVFEQAKSAGVPVCLAIGGGYALPVELTVTAHANTFVAARSVFG
jgi:acetoin utilization deacetylase AcuC-like enzyme